MSTMFSEFTLKNLKFTREKLSKLARREANWGLVFLSPWIIGFFLWKFLPMVASLVFSLTSFNLLHREDIQWAGLENYQHFFSDPLVGVAVKVSLTFALIALPIGIIQPILMAALLNQKNLKMKRILITLFYMPKIVPLVSAVYIWQGVLNARTGWVNIALESIGIPGPDWINTVTWIYPALVMIGLWGVGDMLLYTLATIQGIPTELYEAARVDGAGSFATFRHITIPMITPIIFYNMVLSSIGILMYFLVPFVLKGPNGDPGNATWFYGMYLYKEAFAYSDMGMGATMAWMLFLFAILVTVILFSTQKYWVYYAAEEA
ncbi:MAG: sugar ABC transporter permease [Anaerolineales bacterium]|uniref:Sugar ABC transporter permease n=1 Tax=Candidatus Desulfolinea nitratireducens TaxID=2841698 RepID=A0A8J6NJH3_9CHLR|nr:sugar ABC transporter permease [Candidatus Desulfolinea nitratireducens]MBL6959935.1 sugar ABC transporter permease [Anaerolineales bacterium]